MSTEEVPIVSFLKEVMRRRKRLLPRDLPSSMRLSISWPIVKPTPFLVEAELVKVLSMSWWLMPSLPIS